MLGLPVEKPEKNLFDLDYYRLESQAYERLSREDGLTGLETRVNFEKKLESISADMGRYRDILLMYIDIDQLRVINEEY